MQCFNVCNVSINQHWIDSKRGKQLDDLFPEADGDPRSSASWEQKKAPEKFMPFRLPDFVAFVAPDRVNPEWKTR